MVLKRITHHLKSNISLQARDIRKIFPPEKLCVASLYWLFFGWLEKSPASLNSDVVDSLSAMEIYVKAGTLHETIEEFDDSLPTAILGKLEKKRQVEAQSGLLKNAHKILAGDILVVSSINIINKLSNPLLKKDFYAWAQNFFLNQVDGDISLSKSSESSKSRGSKRLATTGRPKKTPWGWDSILQQLYHRTHPTHRKLPSLNILRSHSISQLFEESLISPDPTKVEKKISQIEKSLKAKWFPRSNPTALGSFNDLGVWLRGELDTSRRDSLSQEKDSQKNKNDILLILKSSTRRYANAKPR